MSFNLGDMGALFKQVQDMQRRMQDLERDLKERVVEAASGGGMVTAKVSGAREVVGIKIAKEVVDPNDVDMLEDLVSAAVNAALKKAGDMRDAEMKKAAGGLGGLPGLSGLQGLF